MEPPNTDEPSHLGGEEGQSGETRGTEQDPIQLEVEEPVQVDDLEASFILQQMEIHRRETQQHRMSL